MICLLDELRFQAQRGDYGPGDMDELIEEVLATYRQGEAATWERTLANGRTLGTTCMVAKSSFTVAGTSSLSALDLRQVF